MVSRIIPMVSRIIPSEEVYRNNFRVIELYNSDSEPPTEVKKYPINVDSSLPETELN